MLTPSQQKALDLSRHLCVTANAGSGKTRVLVERYLSILRDGRTSPQDIVALTFTEKAAGELRKRISEAVAAVPVEGAARRDLMRAGLSAAFIGTIHGYCAQLLREFPVEAGVDAGFAIVEGIDRELLLEESMQEVFRAILRGGGRHPLRDRVSEVVRAIGKRAIREIVTRLVERREIVQRWEEAGHLYASPDEHVREVWNEAIRSFVTGELDSDQLRSDLRVLRSAGRGKRGGEAGDLIARALGEGTYEERVRALLAAVELTVTTDGNLQKAFCGPEAPAAEAVETAARLVRWRTTAAPVARSFLGERDDHDRLLSCTRTLLDTSTEVRERYRTRKSEAGVLDFDDLQLEVRRLLRQDPVRRQLRDRVKFLLVDEYQDTSRIQYELLLPITDGLRGGNLFVVGDPKQSIYAFRNADVRVFEQTRSEILAVSGPEGDVLLGESFRPLRDLAGFTNILFESLMGTGESAGGGSGQGSDVRYDRLVRARSAESGGRVELLLASLPGGEGETISEHELIARRIARMVSGGETLEDGAGSGRRMRWGDIAILLRARTGLPGLEEALFRNGIPYAISGGAGYFQTQDVLDLYNYLRFLSDPADDTALAGLLRSPFFAVSDAELFDAAAGRTRDTLWHHLLGEARKATAPVTVLRAVETLGEQLALAPALPVPELLERIVGQASYEAVLAATPRGAQSAANLEKLRRVAFAYDKQGFVSLYDFVLRLGHLVKHEQREGQGAVPVRDNAVHVMTIHAAKGLEFPVVVLPGLHRPYRQDTGPFLDEDLGVGFPIESGEGKPLVLPVVDLLLERSRRNTAAEEVRILYVGVTRARDVLVLSGDPGARADARAPLQWILSRLGVDRAYPDSSVSLPTITKTLFEDGEGFRRGEEHHEVTVRVLRAADLPPQPVLPDTAGNAHPLPEIAVEPLHALPHGEIFSATRLRTYMECPARYFLRYVIGFPERAPALREDPDREAVDFPADLVGRVFHAVMERVDAVGDAGEGLARLCSRVFDIERAAGPVAREPVIGEVMSLVQAITGSRIWRDILAGRGTRTEFTLSIPFHEDFLTGTLDRTFVDGAGVRVVLDYKTDVVDDRSIGDAAQRHRPQVALYALLAQRYFKVEAVRTILLFARAPEHPVEVTYHVSDMAAIQEEIGGVVGKIRDRVFPANPGTCPYCPVGKGGCVEALKRIKI